MKANKIAGLAGTVPKMLGFLGFVSLSGWFSVAKISGALQTAREYRRRREIMV